MKVNDSVNASATVQRFSEQGSAPRWADMYDAPTRVLADANFRTRRDVTVEYLRRVVPRDGRVLDLGCGTGPVLAEVRKHGLACTGLDLSPDMIERARGRLRTMGLADDDVHLGDCCRTPFADASFDAVVCLGVISYVETYGDVLREIARLVKPGGHVIVSFRNRFNPTLWDPYVSLATLARAATRRLGSEAYAIGRFMNFREVCAEMAACGFEYQEHVGIGFGPIRFRGKALLPESVSMKLSDALAALFARIGWRVPSRWLADVSLWMYRKPASTS